MELEAVKPYAQLLLPGQCFDEFLVDFNFNDGNCWRVFISKCLGYAIILGSILVKLPQILKILSAKSGAGLSVISIYLELIAFTASCAYGYVSNFPFSAYGDSVFMLVQSTIIGVLVLMFNGQALTALVFITIETTALWFLFLSGLAPFDLIWALQAANMPIVATSRMIQAMENYKNGSTGQLSAITVFLMFAGCIGRIFTSYQETGDVTLILNYVVGAICNGIILTQVFIYWNSDTQKQKKEK